MLQPSPFSDFSVYQSNGESIKTQVAGPHPRDPDSVGPGQSTHLHLSQAMLLMPVSG